MVIDIDFIPSEGFSEYLTEPSIYAVLQQQAAQRRVWALVSLELHTDLIPLPRERRAVAACLGNRSVVVAEAYLNPAAHEPVNIHDWLDAEQVCACSCSISRWGVFARSC